MRITQVDLFPVSRRVFLVVHTDEGISGVGECGLAGEYRALKGLLEHVSLLLHGADPFRSEHLWQVMARGLFFPARRALSALISGIDIALWDLKGKALGVPVYQLLGGRVRDHVDCYTHVVATEDTPALVDACLAATGAGWRHLRWMLSADAGVLEPRRAVRVAVDQFAAVREAVGPDVELILDVHARLDPPHAVTLCRELEPMRPFFVEDPIRAEDPKAYEMLRLRTGVPLAAGEHAGSKWDFRPLVENDLIDYARADLALVGGFTETRKIAGWCETHYIGMALHNPLGPVATAAALHFNLACPNVAVQEQPRIPGTELADVIAGQPRWEAGTLLPPESPGLGVTIDLQAARRAAGEAGPPPRLRRPDGTMTNW